MDLSCLTSAHQNFKAFKIFMFIFQEIHLFFFFFLISKSNCIKKAKSTPESIHEVYKATRPKGKKKHKNPYLQPNQSMKSKMDHEAQFTCTLTQSENMYKKDRKIA